MAYNENLFVIWDKRFYYMLWIQRIFNKRIFFKFFLHSSDVTINLKKNSIKIHKKNSEDWNITLINTGEDTETGGRILKIKKYVDNTFCLTYGDGLSNINIRKLINQHKK